MQTKLANAGYLNQENVKVYFDGLPKMVASHSRRVTNIAKFLVKRFEIEDFFFDLKVNQGSFFDACLYHDVGKCNIAQEYLYRDLCNGPMEIQKYMEHVQLALDVIADADIEKYIVDHPNNFKSYFYQTVKYHHGPINGKFPILGQIAYIADQIDNSLFKVASNSVIEFDAKSFESVWKKLLAIFESDGVSPLILKIFTKDKRFLTDILEFLDKLYKRVTIRTRYGLCVNDYNIYDLFRLNDASSKQNEEEAPLKDHEVYARKITYDVNTRYYGKVMHEELMHVALKNKLAAKLDACFFTYVKEELKECYENKQVLTFIGYSIDSMNKITNKRIVKIVDELCIPHNDIGILVDLYYDEFTEVQAAAIKELKLMGFKIAVNNARAEYINLFNEYQFDYAFYDNSGAAKADEIFIELCQSLGTIVILNEAGDYKYRFVLSDVANFRHTSEEEEIEHSIGEVSKKSSKSKNKETNSEQAEGKEAA